MGKTEFEKNIVNAPKKVRVGRVLLWIASILFIFAAIFNILIFILSLAIPEARSQMDSATPGQLFQFYSSPVLSVIFALAAIGGICYLRDISKAKRLASLAAIILLVVFVIDTVVSVRNLVYALLAPNADAPREWLNFALNLLDTQLSGGLYFIGWFLQKDYMGD